MTPYGPLNYLDSSIISFVNQFSRQSWVFDKVMVSLIDNGLLKGGILVMVMWWAWFDGTELCSQGRRHIFITMISCFIAIVVGRGLELMLPFRPRPMHALSMLMPYGMSAAVLEGWSSFPSDHAVLFFALSTGLLFVSRKAGAFALLYTTVVITFPRVYTGFHYPTDIIAGALIGVAIGWAANRHLIRSAPLQSIFVWSVSRPRLFYPMLFLLTYQIADMFNSSRAIAGAGVKLVRHVLY
jgi:undecaprenyl-diphosphatase